MNETTSKNKQEDIEIYSSSLSLLRSTPERNLEERPLSILTDSLMEKKILKYKKREGENEYQDELCEYSQDILVLAVKQGNESQIRQLLALQNEKINSLDMGLWFACKNNDVSIAELLLENGASPDYTLCKIPCIHLSALHGATSLIFSSFEKHPELSKLRMRESVRIQVTPDRPLVEFPEGALPVHMCAFGGLSSLPLLEALLKHSPEVDIGDAKKRSPLMYASIGGNCFSVRALIQRGADIEHKCKEGKTSLLYAAANGKNSVLELLIKRNASLDVRDFENEGLFSYAKDEGVANTILSCTTSCREESAVELLPIRELITKGYHQTLKNLLDSMVTTTQDDKICIDLGQLELKPPDWKRKEKLLYIISKQSPNLPLFDSIVLGYYAEHHMKRYGYVFLTVMMLELIFYLVVLSLAIMLGIRYANANRVSTPLEWFLVVCEIYVLIRWGTLVLFGIIEFGVILKHKYTQNIHLSLNKEQLSKNILLKATYYALKTCLTDVSNIIDALVLFNALIYITLRFTSFFESICSATIVFAVLLYLFSYCGLYRYVNMMPDIGPYLHILLFAMKDSIWFLLVFLIPLFSFTGMFYLATHAPPYIELNPNSTGKYDRVREQFDEDYIWILLTGIRLLIEQGAIVKFNYLEVYNWLMVIVFMVFAFVSLLVMRTLYTGKITNEYKRIHELAGRYTTHRRLAFLLRLHTKSVYSLYFSKTYLQRYNTKVVFKKDKVRSKHPAEFQKIFCKKEQENVHSKLEELRREVLERVHSQENKLDEVIRLIQNINK